MRTVDELQEVLDEDEDAEGGDEENEGRGALFSQRVVDESINCHAEDCRQNGGKKKAVKGLKPRDTESE